MTRINHGSLERTIGSLLRQENNKDLPEIIRNRSAFCREFLELLINKDDFLEKNCPFNYFYIIRDFDDLLNQGYENDFEIFYICCARFLGEYVFSLKRKRMVDVFTEALWHRFIREKTDSFTEDYRELVEYVQKDMNVSILNFYLGSNEYQAFLKYEELAKDVEDRSSKFNIEQQEKIDSFSKLLSSKEETVNRLALQLEKQETAFNFVMLNKGFANILSKKETSKKITFCTLFLLSLILATIPLVYVIGRLFNVLNLQEVIISMSWEQMLPVAGLEFILIYIFRVVLSHYSSLVTQIMQLELRQSLCQFIQSYVEYAKDIKKDDKEVLDKFENLIFSSILSNSDKVPGTFDGVEQLTNLFEKIKNNINEYVKNLYFDKNFCKQALA
jgi:hypothetical protein